MPLLELHEVHTHFPLRRGFLFDRAGETVRAVNGVSLAVEPGEILGLVGESGCGKSTLARTILRLAPLTSGRIRYRGQDLAALGVRALRAHRRAFQIVFQDPYASLNPRMTIFNAIAEPLLAHGLARRAELPARVAELLEQVELAPRLMRKYPHEFSGGQRQRISIARALALQPEFLIADEPVSALDVSVQAGVLNLFARLQRDHRLTLLFISHDLAVVRHLARRIAVMYRGRVVEIGPADAVFHRPLHPYTRALLDAVPCVDPDLERERRREFPSEAPLPDPAAPAGCPFHHRCPRADEACHACLPELVERAPGHRTACVHPL